MHGQKSSSQYPAISAMLVSKGRAFVLIQVLYLGNLTYLMTYSLQLASKGLKIHVFAGRSFEDEFGNTIGGDTQMLSMGFVIVFIYIIFMLGK